MSTKEQEWLNTVNPYRTTGVTWNEVVRDGNDRYGAEIDDDQIERIFWEQGLRPLQKTQEQHEEYLYGKVDPRINPTTGEELV